MQIVIHPQDRKDLRSLWSKVGTEKIFNYYRLLFRATCPPFSAIFVLQNCANDHKQEHSEASVLYQAAIIQQFYMDDFMQTYPSEKDARRSAEEIKLFYSQVDSI